MRRKAGFLKFSVGVEGPSKDYIIHFEMLHFKSTYRLFQVVNIPCTKWPIRIAIQMKPVFLSLSRLILILQRLHK